MKKIVLLSIIFLLSVTIMHAQPGPAEQVAEKISQKMQDSLGLTTAQKSQLYAINMQLYEQKQAAWRSNTDQNSLTRQIQKIENTRDSLYKAVLSPEEYQLYKQKKTNLISNK